MGLSDCAKCWETPFTNVIVGMMIYKGAKNMVLFHWTRTEDIARICK